MYGLEYAQGMAEGLMALLDQACFRVEVAGSIRRKRTPVKDIDLVAIPHSISHLGMIMVTHKMIRVLTKKRLDTATKIIKFTYHTIPGEIYIADFITWPMILLVRTGSKDHNQRLATLAKQKGLQFKADGQGILDASGKRVSGDTEESIFEALGLEYVEPEERE